MYKFIKKYLSCKIIETLENYIITNENGATLGSAKTLSGAESVAEDYRAQTIGELIKNNKKIAKKKEVLK